jgi:hypothetical protein
MYIYDITVEIRRSIVNASVDMKVTRLVENSKLRYEIMCARVSQ